MTSSENKPLQYGRQDCCRSGYYSNIGPYHREIILVSIPRFFRLLNTLEQLLLRLDGYLIVQFNVKGVQVLSTTLNVITLNVHAHCSWALSLHICSRLTKDIADLKEATLVEVEHHKEESTSIIKTDSDDRNAIRDKLETCVDPIDVSQGQNLINIVTGKISNRNINVETLFRLEKPSCKKSSRLVPQDSTKRSRGRLLP